MVRAGAHRTHPRHTRVRNAHVHRVHTTHHPVVHTTRVCTTQRTHITCAQHSTHITHAPYCAQHTHHMYMCITHLQGAHNTCAHTHQALVHPTCMHTTNAHHTRAHTLHTVDTPHTCICITHMHTYITHAHHTCAYASYTVYTRQTHTHGLHTQPAPHAHTHVYTLHTHTSHPHAQGFRALEGESLRAHIPILLPSQHGGKGPDQALKVFTHTDGRFPPQTQCFGVTEQRRYLQGGGSSAVKGNLSTSRWEGQSEAPSKRPLI